jgi:outer membrane protein insertion porin family
MESPLSEFLEQDYFSAPEVTSTEDVKPVEAEATPEELPVAEVTEAVEELAPEPTLEATPEPTPEAPPEPVKVAPEPAKPVTRPRPPALGKPLTPRNISRFSPYRK